METKFVYIEPPDCKGVTISATHFRAFQIRYAQPVLPLQMPLCTTATRDSC